jgi:hypothetical protein
MVSDVRGCLLQCTSWKLTCVLWEIRNEQCRHARRESHVDARRGKKVFQRDDLCAATSLSSINFATRGARLTTIVVALESLELIRKIGRARSRCRTEANCLPSSHYMVVVVGDVWTTSGASRRAIHRFCDNEPDRGGLQWFPEIAKAVASLVSCVSPVGLGMHNGTAASLVSSFNTTTSPRGRWLSAAPTWRASGDAVGVRYLV